MSRFGSEFRGSTDRPRGGLFESTSWSQVLAAGDSGHASNRSALQNLCMVYWPPLHAYVCRRIRDTHMAEDLTQSFFETLLAGKALKMADPARGRFRSFLIQAVEWHLAHEFRRATAVKRGGHVRLFPLDFSSRKSEPADDNGLSAEHYFEREWALTLLHQATQRLQAEQDELGKHEQFELLKGFLTGSDRTGGYSPVCAELGMSESAARMAVSRLRTRYREILREEILRTVASSQDVDDEIRHLFRALLKR